VLEVGCGSGGNLMAMATASPGSEFLGIDLSPKHVERANSLARAAGLSNVRFETMDFTQFPSSAGVFDYVIAHGVYSWVSPPTADALLALLARHLAATGLGYVSYNTYPGWHLRGMVRDMMMYHVRHLPDASPTARVIEARRLLGFLDKFATDVKNNPNPAYATNLAGETKFLASKHADYVAHDHMERFNEPVYFWQFAERMNGHGLKYVDELLPPMWHATATRTVRDQMPQLAKDPVALEQYVDFLMCTYHRQSLVAHAGVKSVRNDAKAPLDGFFVRGIGHDAGVPSEIDLRQGVPQPFPTREAMPISVKDQFVKAVLKLLHAGYPAAISLDELLAKAVELTGLSPRFAKQGSQERFNVERSLLHCHRMGLLVLVAYDLRIASTPGERPLATSLARLQAKEGGGVTNLLHQWVVDIKPASRAALAKCDGSHRLADLDGAAVKALARAGFLLE
jgi:SAM-dependent methyltransferase